MKKGIIIGFIIVIAIIVGTVMVSMVSMAIRRNAEIYNYEAVLERTARYIEGKSIGVINLYDVDDINAEVLKRAGIEDSDNIRFSLIGDYKNMTVWEMIVYEDGQKDIPVSLRKIAGVYLYGDI